MTEILNTHTQQIREDYAGHIPDWQEDARCMDRDPDLMFPTNTRDVNIVIEFCRGCDVREACLDYAIENGEKLGIWGGTSERERKKMIKAHRLKLFVNTVSVEPVA